MSVWKDLSTDVGGDSLKILFLDRDGVVIQDRDYLSDPGGVELVPGAASAMAEAKDAGFLLVGVSNQSGIGRGRFSEADFAGVMTRLDSLLASSGTCFDAFYYCPHGPDDGCGCRKPLTGLVEDLVWFGDLDRPRSWVVGDKVSDIAFGRNIGLGGVLVQTGYGSQQLGEVRSRWGGDPGVLVAADLSGAVAAILAGTDSR